MCVARELSSNLLNTVTTIRKTSEDLNNQLSQIDKLICDIKHEIEFGKFDVFRGYKKFKQLQDTLHERRDIKNEWELIQPLIGYVGNIEKNVDKVHTTIVNKELSFKNRKYKPRVLKIDSKS
jgi:hypothetical protein